MTIAIRIRRLRLADYAAMIRLFEICGLEPRVDGRDGRRAIGRQLRATSNVYLGAFDRGRLVGAVLGTHDTRKGWINRLAVHPEFRRRGVARRLVRACETGLRRHGIEMFAALIEADNRASEQVFRDLGYELTQLTYARRKLRDAI